MRYLLLFAVALLVAACASDGTQEPEAPAKRIIAAEGAPEALGPYTQGVQVGTTLYLSGQIGIDPATGALVEGGIEAETRRAMDNLQAVLEAAGFSMADVVEAQVFLADLEKYGAMNAVYGSYFASAPPARAAVQVARLPRDARVEIKLTAVRAN